MNGADAIWLGFGVILILVGIHTTARRQLSMRFEKVRRSRHHWELALVGGPAVLAGTALMISGLMMAGPMAYHWFRSGTVPLEVVPGATLPILAAGTLAGVLWQIARNVRSVLGSDEAREKVTEKLLDAMAKDDD